MIVCFCPHERRSVIFSLPLQDVLSVLLLNFGQKGAPHGTLYGVSAQGVRVDVHPNECLCEGWRECVKACMCDVSDVV